MNRRHALQRERWSAPLSRDAVTEGEGHRLSLAFVLPGLFASKLSAPAALRFPLRSLAQVEAILACPCTDVGPRRGPVWRGKRSNQRLAGATALVRQGGPGRPGA